MKLFLSLAVTAAMLSAAWLFSWVMHGDASHIDRFAAFVTLGVLGAHLGSHISEAKA